MEGRACNPFLPLDEYVPDGEAHVFGDRVYLYGSHDRENGERFCERDYVVYSAPVSDISAWTCHGVSYKKEQDPRSKNGKLVDLYAPDCVRGNDGKYYLYYVAMGPNTANFGPIGVAVSSKPEGPFAYLGDVSFQDGTPVLSFLTNDPAVLNDRGKIYLYYGWGLGRDFRAKPLRPLYDVVLSRLCHRSLRAIKAARPSILSCAVVELEDDMRTVKSEPRAILDSVSTAPKGTEFHEHAFYEAPSIRRFGDTYVLVYSSGRNNELAYATSKDPDRGFAYQGVLISSSDLGYRGNRLRKAPAGTIHGCLECIGGRYYVFYHRCTNDTDFSRQACAEPTQMVDGAFPQVEITTQGMGKPLLAKGTYPAALCCHLFGPKTKGVRRNGPPRNVPRLVARKGESFATGIGKGTRVGFKYLEFGQAREIAVTVRNGNGAILVTDGKREIARIEVLPSPSWQTFRSPLRVAPGIKPLYFVYEGKGTMDFKEFTIE